MKKLIFVCFLPLFLLYTGCNKEKIVENKPGVSLPMVTNLDLQKTGNNQVRLTWSVPTSIPTEIQQPLNIYLEVNEIISATKAVSVFSIALTGAPAEFIYQLPNVAKKYDFTVKLMGTTKNMDVNYSNTIYSLGQTVSYR